MYPEDVYNCGLPLPFELLRTIAFQVAYEHVKKKLRFPEYDGARHHKLRLKWEFNEVEGPLHSIYMIWASHNERIFSVIHIDYYSNRENRRSYEYHFESGMVHIGFNCHGGSKYY